MNTTDSLLERLYLIPDELVELKQWIVWRYESGRKIPYQANNPTLKAKCNDRHTWASFIEAVNTFAHCLDTKEQFAGISFVLSKDDPYTGIDLDNCVNGDAIHPAALKIVKQIKGYAEISPSLTGIKIFTKAKLPIENTGKSISNTDWGGAMEIYQHGRFFTVTGREVTQCQQ